MEHIEKSNTNFKRIEMFLEDKEWENAIKYCEKSLDENPESSQTYIYYLLAKFKFTTTEEMAGSSIEFFNDSLYKKALDFADENEKAVIAGLKYEALYIRSTKILEKAKRKKHYKEAQKLLSGILEYKNAEELFIKCNDKLSKIKEKNKKRLKICLISFFALLLVIIISFVCSFFVLKNSKKNLLADIEVFKTQRTEIEKEYFPIQKEIQPFINELENKVSEKEKIEDNINKINEQISELNEKDRYYNKCIQDMLSYVNQYSYNRNLYLSAYKSVRESILKNYDYIAENKDKIDKKRNELKNQESELEKANGAISIAQENYNNVIKKYKKEMTEYDKKTNDIDISISTNEKEIKEIELKFNQFPYSIIAKVFE